LWPLGVTVKLLIDEYLHTSLVQIARTAGHVADHVNNLRLGSSKDGQLMATIRRLPPQQSAGYTFVLHEKYDP
jgi:hypothetical protein